MSSLSNPRIVELISKYFVPAWVSRDDYQREARDQDEKAELVRIDHERARRKLKGGNVTVFILADNGDVLATQPVVVALKPENLRTFLEEMIAKHKLQPRSQEAIQASAAKPTEAKPPAEGNRFIHIWTRLDTGPNNGLTNDRVELTAAQCKAFLPPADAPSGTSWDIPEEVAHKLLQYCYPPGPHWMVKDCKVLKGKLKATLADGAKDEARIQLKGEMELQFPVGKPTEGRITARFIGTARGDRKKQTLVSLVVVSEQAEYVWQWQGKPQPRKMRIALELEP